MIRDEKDINFQDRSIFLPAENTKGKKDRYVFFSQKMATELRRWLQYRDRYKDSEFLFCTIRGTQLDERSFESNFTVYGERIGKKDIHPHQLRNNFAKKFLMSGGDIYTLSQILGHSSVKVTEECYLDLKNELNLIISNTKQNQLSICLDEVGDIEVKEKLIKIHFNYNEIVKIYT